MRDALLWVILIFKTGISYRLALMGLCSKGGWNCGWVYDSASAYTWGVWLNLNFSAVKILLGFKVKIYPLKVVSIQDIRALWLSRSYKSKQMRLKAGYVLLDSWKKWNTEYSDNGDLLSESKTRPLTMSCSIEKGSILVQSRRGFSYRLMTCIQCTAILIGSLPVLLLGLSSVGITVT